MTRAVANELHWLLVELLARTHSGIPCGRTDECVARGEWDEVIRCCGLRLKAYQSSSNLYAQAILNAQLATAFAVVERPAAALRCYREALRLYLIVDRRNAGIVLLAVGKLYESQQDSERASQSYREAAELLDATGDPLAYKAFEWQSDLHTVQLPSRSLQPGLVSGNAFAQRDEAVALQRAGLVYRQACAWEEAVEAFRRSIELLQQIQDETSLALAYHNLGDILQMQRKWSAARSEYEKALKLYQKTGDTATSDQVLGKLRGVVRFEVSAKPMQLRNRVGSKSQEMDATHQSKNSSNKQDEGSDKGTDVSRTSSIEGAFQTGSSEPYVGEAEVPSSVAQEAMPFVSEKDGRPRHLVATNGTDAVGETVGQDLSLELELRVGQEGSPSQSQTDEAGTGESVLSTATDGEFASVDTGDQSTVLRLEKGVSVEAGQALRDRASSDLVDASTLSEKNRRQLSGITTVRGTHPRLRLLPVCEDRVAAGQPIVAWGRLADYMTVTTVEIEGRRFHLREVLTGDAEPLIESFNFAVLVKGESMEPRIHDGDCVLVRQVEPSVGDCVVVRMPDTVDEDRIAVKNYYPEADHCLLLPENDAAKVLVVIASEDRTDVMKSCYAKFVESDRLEIIVAPNFKVEGRVTAILSPEISV